MRVIKRVNGVRTLALVATRELFSAPFSYLDFHERSSFNPSLEGRLHDVGLDRNLKQEFSLVSICR